MAQPAHGPWSAGPTAGYKCSNAHPVYGGGNGRSSGGVSIGQINFTMTTPTGSSGTGAGMSATGNAGAALAQTFAKQLRVELGRMNLDGAIATGVNS